MSFIRDRQQARPRDSGHKEEDNQGGSLEVVVAIVPPRVVHM